MYPVNFLMKLVFVSFKEARVSNDCLKRNNQRMGAAITTHIHRRGFANLDRN